MPFLALIVAATALSARCLNASIANRTGRRNARITEVRQQFECGDASSDDDSKRKICQGGFLRVFLRLRKDPSSIRIANWKFE